ncbi:MAG: glycoside hydrolase family 113 [Chloroflexota bacterium]
MKTNPNRIRQIALVSLATLLLFSGPACAISLFEWTAPSTTPRPPTPGIPTAAPLPTTQVTFHAALNAALAPNETLTLRILDEVTGLGFNHADYTMQPRDALNYVVTLPLAVDSVVKYRYVRLGGSETQETSGTNQPIRYRMHMIVGSSETIDLIAGWSDRPFGGPTGSVQGTAINADTGTAIPNLLVTAGGVQAVTDSAGRFVLPGLPVGTHNVVGYSMDGGYATFEQGATVAQGLATPVEMRVKPTVLVPVTFTVHVPKDTQPGAPLRIAGNLIQLGNTFADLRGGLSVIPERMPVLNYTAEGVYSNTIYLPVGTDVHYKYTLGDGFWNAERNDSGGVVVRQLIVPANGAVIEEQIVKWESGHSAPISFEVTVPPETPAGDIIYIQFNPYGWTEPIPMWSAGNNVWKYTLYGPLDLRSIFYRYCRNGQCGVADDDATRGESAGGRQVGTAITGQIIRDSVNRWAWMSMNGPATLVGSNVIERQPGFMTGIEFQAYYHPNWSTFIPQAMQNTQALGSNWVILTPTWTYSSVNPLAFGTRPGADPLWTDSAWMISQGRALNLNVGIFPQPHFSASSSDTSFSADFWRATPLDPTWWLTWFDSYRTFAIHYADLASQAGAQALILGGDWIGPALPNGTLPDGSPSGVPSDAETRWLAILNEVRAHFRGQVLWAMPYAAPNLSTPSFISQTDGVYLLISGNLSTNLVPSKSELEAAAASLLDNTVQPLQSMLGKPVYLAFAYPSANGAAANCLPLSSGACMDWKALSQPNADRAEIQLNLQLQADIYEILLAAVNTRPWVSGVIARGYYPPTLLQDKSASIHGKPAGDVLWYWYQRFLGLVR